MRVREKAKGRLGEGEGWNGEVRRDVSILLCSNEPYSLPFFYSPFSLFDFFCSSSALLSALSTVCDG